MIQDYSKINKKYSRNNAKLKIAIIRSSFHSVLTKNLEKGSIDHLISCGIKEENISTFTVPGSWEIPIVVKKLAKSRKYQGIITLGVILKGDTYHFELIANESARALMDISLQFDIPIAFEILAVYNLKQAEKRSTGKHNKGIEAAQAILETIKTLNEV